MWSSLPPSNSCLVTVLNLLEMTILYNFPCNNTLWAFVSALSSFCPPIHGEQHGSTFLMTLSVLSFSMVIGSSCSHASLNDGTCSETVSTHEHRTSDEQNSRRLGDGVRATVGCDVVIDKVAFHGMCVCHMAERLTVGLVGEAFSYGLVLNRGR